MYEIEKWKELYALKNSTITIGSLYNVDPEVVRYWLKANGVDTSKKKKQFDETAFEKIDNPDKAYWLGFIYADGYIATKDPILGISLHRRDEEHLNLFGQFLNSKYEVKRYSGKTSYGDVEYSRICLRSKKTKEDLIKLGVFEKKSLILKFPTESQVPEKFIWHFVRGYFDGDGCLTKNASNNKHSLFFCGTKEFLEGLSIVLFGSIKNIYKEKRNSVNNYKLLVGGENQIFSILQNMYKKGKLSLERKRNKYLDFVVSYYSRLME
jgi:intein-encoded DNA endonuclease-like protein